MSNRKRNRKHSKIDKLPPDLKSAVDMMLQGDFTYAEVADFIRNNAGVDISETSVWRYTQGLNATVQSLRMAQENMRVISEEMDKHPNLDATEAIARLLSHQMIAAIQEMPQEKWQEIDPEKLLDKSTALMRAVSYKKGVDVKTRSVKDMAFESFKEDIFSALSAEKPELYRQLVEYINSRKEETE